MSEYRAHWRPQKDGSAKEWTSCNTDSHGMTSDRAKKGVNPHVTSAPWLPAITKLTYGWKSTLPTMSSAIRAWIDRNVPMSWIGTSMGQNMKAVKALYGVVLGYAHAVAWSIYVSYVVAHRGTVVSILYSSVHGTPYDACRTFDGRHAIYVNERRWNATTSRYEFLVFDPLADHRYSWIPQGPQWWPSSLLQKAMNAAGIEFTFTPQTTAV